MEKKEYDYKESILQPTTSKDWTPDDAKRLQELAKKEIKNLVKPFSFASPRRGFGRPAERSYY